MPSIQYKMISGLFKLIGVNKMLDKEGAEFDKLLETYRKKQKKPLKAPYKKMSPDFVIDKRNFPSIDIFYGTREVMIAYLKDFQDVCKKYGVTLKTHIGKGMMHCWGAMEFVPEARAVRREYFEALR